MINKDENNDLILILNISKTWPSYVCIVLSIAAIIIGINNLTQFDSSGYKSYPYYDVCDKPVLNNPQFNGTSSHYERLIEKCIQDKIQEEDESE